MLKRRGISGRAIAAAGMLGAALLGASTASADVVYAVNQAFGGGSVKGSITTDGTIGALAAPDFVAWSLLLTGAVGGTYNLTNANSAVVVIGADLTATPTQILFNFSGDPNSYLLVQDGLYSGAHYWCNAAGNGDCPQGNSVSPGFYYDANSVNVAASGLQTIAVVPETATWALMTIGFGGLAFALRRRTRRDRTLAAG